MEAVGCEVDVGGLDAGGSACCGVMVGGGPFDS